MPDAKNLYQSSITLELKDTEGNIILINSVNFRVDELEGLKEPAIEQFLKDKIKDLKVGVAENVNRE